MQIDPSGASFGWKASAIGNNYVSAKTFLEKVHMLRKQSVCSLRIYVFALLGVYLCVY
jgi:20S proteasome alpha/beta subunit